MSMDNDVVCDECKQYTHFCKTAFRGSILVDDAAKQFILEHWLHNGAQGLRIVDANQTDEALGGQDPIPDDYENMNP